MFEKEGLDAVIVSTKPHQQLQIVKDCLNAGVHVFVEKNLGWDAKEAKEIAEFSRETGKFVQVGFMKRFAPAYVEAFKLMNSEEFGEVVSISGMWGCRNFVTTPLEFMLFASSHYVNLMTSIMGEFKQVQGNMRVVDESISISTTAVGKNGINSSVLFIATPSWAKLHEELYITGTNGYIHVVNGKKLDYHLNPKPAETPRWQIMDEVTASYSSVVTTSSGGWQDLYQKGFVGEIEHFLECVGENKQPITNAEDNVLTMDAIDKIVEAVG